MNSLVLRTVLLIVLGIACIAPASALAAETRIIGGDKVPPATFGSTYSSVVSVRSSVIWAPGRARQIPDVHAHTCGGTVIAPRLVLTAAHCVTGMFPVVSGPGLSVLAGTPVLSQRAASTGAKVTAVYVHPEFGRGSSNLGFPFGSGDAAAGHDVAVLRLAAPIDGVTPMRIVQPAEDAVTWGAGGGRVSGATAIGWGFTRSPWRMVRLNRAVHSAGLAIRADRRCERSDSGLGVDARDFDAATMLCAGTADGPGVGSGKGACFGDSGGPLLATAGDGSLRVVGIASWTPSSKPCGSWSVFTRVAAVRDWIESIPADEGGAGGLVAPRDVTSTVVGPNSIELAWSAAPVGVAARYRVSRVATGLSRFFGSFDQPFLLDAGTTDAAERSLRLDGVEPQRRGQRELRSVRVDVEDASGNRVAGRVVRVPAPVDTTPPSTLAAPVFVDRRGRRGESLRLRATSDDDCVGGYGVQVQTTGGWRGLGTWTNQVCEPLLAASPFGFGFSGARATAPTVTLPLRKLDRGRHRVRVVAFDRAGNSTVSPAVVVELDERVRGVRPGSCLTSGTGYYCSPSRRFAGVAGSAVNVVVG